MSVDNVKDNFESVNTNFESDMRMQKIREEVAKSYAEYRNSINFMVADAPISVLGLTPVIENALHAHGCLRVYDLFNCNFVEVKGLGATRIRELTASLDQFLSML